MSNKSSYSSQSYKSSSSYSPQYYGRSQQNTSPYPTGHSPYPGTSLQDYYQSPHTSSV